MTYLQVSWRGWGILGNGGILVMEGSLWKKMHVYKVLSYRQKRFFFWIRTLKSPFVLSLTRLLKYNEIWKNKGSTWTTIFFYCLCYFCILWLINKLVNFLKLATFKCLDELSFQSLLFISIYILFCSAHTPFS